MAMANSEQDILAGKLRKCYQFQRNYLSRILMKPAHYRVPACWDGGSIERKKNTLWHKLARFCAKRKINPIHYIQWCLSVKQVGLNQPPETNQLLAPQRMDAYRDNQDKQRESIRISLRCQKNAADAEFNFLKICKRSSEDAWISTLCNNSIEWSPLLRYAFALRFGWEPFLTIARHWEERALFQYQSNPAAFHTYLGPVLAAALPSDFAERAEALYDQLLEQEP